MWLILNKLFNWDYIEYKGILFKTTIRVVRTSNGSIVINKSFIGNGYDIVKFLALNDCYPRLIALTFHNKKELDILSFTVTPNHIEIGIGENK